MVGATLMAYKNDWQKYKKLEMSKKEILVSQLCWQGNTVTAAAETIQDLINSLDVKTSNGIKWMKNNDMIANPNKFNPISPGRFNTFSTWGRIPSPSVTLLPFIQIKPNLV